MFLFVFTNKTLWQLAGPNHVLLRAATYNLKNLNGRNSLRHSQNIVNPVFNT